MEILSDEKNLFYKTWCNNKYLLLKEGIEEMKSKILLSPVSGVVKKMDSNNSEIIIKSCEGEIIFLYLNQEFLKEYISSFVKEGDLIFKGQAVLDISCGYEEKDLTIFTIKL